MEYIRCTKNLKLEEKHVMFDYVHLNFCAKEDIACHQQAGYSSSSYTRQRCLLPSRKQLSSLAPPGCHKALPSVVLVLATYSTSEHHVVGSAAVDVLQHDVCIAGARLRLTNLELAVHVGIKSVVPSSQPEQNNLLWARMHHKVVGNFGSEAEVLSLYYRRFRFNETSNVGTCTHGRPAK